MRSARPPGPVNGIFRDKHTAFVTWRNLRLCDFAESAAHAHRMGISILPSFKSWR